MMKKWVDTHGSPKRLVWRVYGGGIYSEDTFIADIGDSPKDWDTITITINEIEKVVY